MTALAKTCGAADCGRPSRALGLCDSHYRRAHRGGDVDSGPFQTRDPIDRLYRAAARFQLEGHTVTRGAWAVDNLRKAALGYARHLGWRPGKPGAL